MSLLSLAFAEFVAIVALLYHACPRGARPALLCAASVLFCALNSVASAVALIIATAIAFLLGRRIDRADENRLRRAYLALGLVVLVLHLLLIKLAAAFHWSSGRDWLTDVLAAFGASYYSLKLAGYLIDVYWRRYPAWSNPVDFGSFAMFFPLLPAGPIQRASEFHRPADESEIARLMSYGLRRTLLGLTKKLLVADRLGGLVDYIAQSHSGHANVLWVMAYLFPLQLYVDFSALTDIAIGVACLFGIKPPENFSFPFFAGSISEFWRRWHMSLTRWLGDYVFMPLRMATRTWGKFGLAISIVANMVLIAMWHAISFGWLLFGLINASFLIADALTLRARSRLYKRSPAAASAAAAVGPLLVFHMIAFSLVCFRAQSLADMAYYFGHLLDGTRAPLSALKQLFYSYGRGPCAYDFGALCVFMLFEAGLYLRSRNWKPLSKLPRFDAMPTTVRWAVYYAAILGVGIASQQSSRFIYVQF